MKKIIFPILAIFFALLILPSCKKDENKAVLKDGTPGTVSASSSTIVLDRSKINASDTSVIFTITNANFGYPAAITNVLQIDSMGDGWKNPQTMTIDAGATQQPLSTLDFNSLLLRLNLAPGQSSKIQIRVVNSVATTIASINSDAITLSVTPFSMASSVYVPGAYQGWAPNTADSLISATSNGIYTGIIDFTGSDLTFKITTTPATNFSGTNYGLGSAPGTVSATGGNLTAPATGGFLLTLNVNDNTLKIAPQWSIIGDATAGGWDTDTDMFLDKTKNTWYITTTLVGDGTKAMKFRFNNDWTVNLGAGTGSGLSQGGGNITIPVTAPAGDTYKITMDPNANTYTLVKQ
jgi:hypothetical protein